MLVLELDPVGTIAVVLAMSAGSSYGVTQVVKSLWMGWLAHRKQAEPWFYNAVLRIVACVAGAVMGFVSLEHTTGLGIGLAAGAINTYLVQLVKRYFRRKAEA